MMLSSIDTIHFPTGSLVGLTLHVINKHYANIPSSSHIHKYVLYTLYAMAICTSVNLLPARITFMDLASVRKVEKAVQVAAQATTLNWITTTMGCINNTTIVLNNVYSLELTTLPSVRIMDEQRCG